MYLQREKVCAPLQQNIKSKEHKETMELFSHEHIYQSFFWKQDMSIRDTKIIKFRMNKGIHRLYNGF